MPKPTGDLLRRLGPAVYPFERYNRLNGAEKKPLTGETDSFKDRLYDATDDELPPGVRLTSNTQLTKDCMYLWIINKDGLWVILEQTPNKNADRKVVCHSNITEGSKALQGGELWYLGEKNVRLNYKSGRYGAETIEHEIAVIEYFKEVGYDAVAIDD